jgi:hypothetical protein
MREANKHKTLFLKYCLKIAEAAKHWQPLFVQFVLVIPLDYAE